MIRLVTAGRLRRLREDADQALAHARKVQGQANAAWSQQIRELYAVTDRAERAEAATSEVGTILARAMEQLSATEQELLLKAIEIRRLRTELEAGPAEGSTLTVLLHYGEPHTVYASREDAVADTGTHGVAAGTPWVPADEHPASASMWRLAAFIYNAESKGFRRAQMPAPQPVEGAA
ncbi:hypothetical protein SAMN05428944_7396 [Streptomyces sp. 1222.5]|uniref:hypothetical protein n=1 Tax=unclassified Streptomyces TaxID=2593676 RepID=UPI00089C48D8|nr:MULTISPECIES: hypothetical protein [unclassified Streptomyces]PKW05578.1 hypothetical protein BX260_0695 [Streptomyces sp. 5112.2]SED35082.1 hypothetical protein SAMN05428944_7396 [Streptomyces sp. 1222.5]